MNAEANDRFIKRDRMRYAKNKLSSRLALLAIAFNVLFFVSIYKSDVGTYYYTMTIGASVVYNLVFMLIAFLCSEGVKNYKCSYSFVLLALSALQIVRIFIIPGDAHQTLVAGSLVMEDGQYTRVVVYLCASAFCLFASAVVNFIKSFALTNHLKKLEAGVRG